MIRTEHVKIPFAYAAGRGGSRFLAALRDQGLILGARCSTCDRVLCPARSFCPRCGAGTGDFVAVGPGGRLTSWTELPGRGVLGLIVLDGADTAICHRLLGPGPWNGGDRVRARLAADRSGSILDIEGFDAEAAR